MTTTTEPTPADAEPFDRSGIQMPDAYADCTTVAATNARYRERFAAHNEKKKGINAADHNALQEEHRRALWVLTHGERKRPVTVDPETGEVRVTKPRRSTVETVASPDGAKNWSITCAVCNTEQPSTKFPTVTSKPGHRETTCRACKTAARTS